MAAGIVGGKRRLELIEQQKKGKVSEKPTEKASAKKMPDKKSKAVAKKY